MLRAGSKRKDSCTKTKRQLFQATFLQVFLFSKVRERFANQQTLFIHSRGIWGKYERDEMIPSIEVAKNLARILDTTVGYLLGETDEVNLLKDPEMLKRLNNIMSFPMTEREHIIYTLDAMIKAAKLKSL